MEINKKWSEKNDQEYIRNSPQWILKVNWKKNIQMGLWYDDWYLKKQKIIKVLEIQKINWIRYFIIKSVNGKWKNSDINKWNWGVT
jgi:hypothetical protein